MYYFPTDPPYFLLVAGILMALTSGAAFAATLKLIVQKWSSDRAAKVNASLPTGKLLIPFLGMSGGVCFFLCAGLEIFGFPAWLAYAVALPLTLLISLLIWFQLRSMFVLVEREGFEAIDIDSMR